MVICNLHPKLQKLWLYLPAISALKKALKGLTPFIVSGAKESHYLPKGNVQVQLILCLLENLECAKHSDWFLSFIILLQSHLTVIKEHVKINLFQDGEVVSKYGGLQDTYYPGFFRDDQQ